MPDYAAARFFMVEGQIRPNKVTDQRLVEALLDIPRELFVPEPARGIAYVDEDVACGGGRYLVEPMVFARMLQILALKAGDRVLDVGCATGYSTAVLARLAGSVVGVESDAALAERAAAALNEVGALNAEVVTGALADGHEPRGPYDVIVFGGTIAEVPAAVAAQLAENGRMVAPVLNRRGVGEIRLFQRVGGVLSSRAVFEASPPMLPGLEPKPVFEF